MGELTATSKQISPEQRSALAQKLRGNRAPDSSGMKIPNRQDSGPGPLSFSQQRLWFLDQLDPGNSAYNVYRAVRIKGALDKQALERSFQEIVRRHEILRTTIKVERGIPCQITSPSVTVPLWQIDLRDVPASKREGEILRLANEEAHRPFDLAKDLLLRTALLQVGAEEQVLLVTTHHIAADGWSVGILFSELSLLYEAFATGKPSPLPELPIQFADFAAWQRQWLTGPILEKQLDYWKEKLAGLPPGLDLPTDRPRPALQRLENFHGERHYFLMPKALLDALTSLSRQEGVTLFMTLMAAFKVLLSRYSGQEDIAIGSPIAGRNFPELEKLIGCFSNTLVLRSDLSGHPSFRDYLGRVREVALGAFANQDVPFEKLVEELHPKRVPNRMPLFQVNFRLTTAPLPPLKLSGLNLTFLESDNRMAKFDLALELCARRDGLGGYVEYFTDVFDRSTIKDMCVNFKTLLDMVVNNPGAPLNSLINALGQARSTLSRVPNMPKSMSLREIKRKPIDAPANRPTQEVSIARAISGEPGISSASSGNDKTLRYTLRKATMKDCGFIYQLRVNTLKPYVAQFPDWPEEKREAYYLDFDPTIHDIIVVDGKDAGDVSILRGEHEIRFVNLHLLPEYQGRGLGTAILKAAIAEAESKRVPVVLQGVLKSNPAIRLYERLGFVIMEETDLRYSMIRLSQRPNSRCLRDIKRKGIHLQ